MHLAYINKSISCTLTADCELPSKGEFQQTPRAKYYSPRIVAVELALGRYAANERECHKSKSPELIRAGAFVIRSLAVSYFRAGNPHYHRR